MKITRSQACHILGVAEGASVEEIRSNYKHLARKWHPDKQDGTIGTEEATKKFQEVSAAYKKLTSNERDSDDEGMTLAEMMDLYKQLFSFGNPMNQCNCRHHRHPAYPRYNEDASDYDDYDYTDEEESDDEFWESIASRLRSKYEARKYSQKDTTDIPTSKITEEEALKNAQELIEEEEIEKRRKEKKKAKKKKKKEKRKQKDKDVKPEEDKVDKMIMDKKNIEKHKEEKPKIDPPNTHLTNGHTSPLKNNTKNAPNKNHRRVDSEVTGDKPIKRVIVQEDIRPSIPKDTTKREKGIHKGHGQRSSINQKDSSDDEEQFDANSAFFARAASKAPQSLLHSQPLPAKDPVESKIKQDPFRKNGVQKYKEINKSAINSKEKKEENHIIDTRTVRNFVENKKEIKINGDADLNSIDNIVIKSRQLAVKGNDFAAKADYLDAIEMFTEAIQLDPTDFRFFGNRSYCYDRTQQYEKAFKDAESATVLAAQWPKGYFRKGRALTGLERYQEAEEAFQHVLQLDADCPDAQFELAKVRVRILTDMGFDVSLAEESVRKYGTVQFALEALLAGNVSPRSDGEEQMNLSDLERNLVIENSNLQTEKQPILITAQTQEKPQQKCTALWVGNVCATSVTDKQLTQVFSKYGKLVGVRLLPEKYCAFVNYHSPEDASRALEKLQGVELGGQNLLIRYPNNPPPGSVVFQGPPDKSSPAVPVSKKSIDKSDKSKVTGPVNGNECYFWRTTGCVFDNNCRYRHVSTHKGVDLAKVHAKYGKS